MTLVIALATPLFAQQPDFDRLKAQAEAARDTDQVPEAIGFYQKLVVMRPDWTEGWWHIGALSYDRDNHASGAKAFAKFVVLEPDNGQGWAMLGLCEVQLQKNIEALQHLTKARTLGLGGNEELARVVRYHQAVLFNRGKQFEVARAVLVGFAVENRESPPVLDAMGMSVLRISEPYQALSADRQQMVREFGKSAFLEASRKQPDAVNMFGDLARKYAGKPDVAYAYGAALVVGKEGAKALAQFEEELKLNPNHVPAMLQLALELIAQSRAEEALPYAQKAAKLEPDSFAAYYIQGRIFLAANEIQKAIRMLEQAKSLAPDASQVRYMLAQAYQRAGRAAEAKKERAEFERLREIEKQRQGMIATYVPEDAQNEK
ncbi:MAG: tetratricopeptide repeat protein [Acidobacteria bacterium]|nr:MAG: tetratricopeptide repeat protein [Acidobacteriota bacterium]